MYKLKTFLKSVPIMLLFPLAEYLVSGNVVFTPIPLIIASVLFWLFYPSRTVEESPDDFI